MDTVGFLDEVLQLTAHALLSEAELHKKSKKRLTSLYNNWLLCNVSEPLRIFQVFTKLENFENARESLPLGLVR